MDARLEALPRVVERSVRRREVDDHVGVAQDVLQRRVELGVGAPDKRHVLGALDGLAHRLSHPAGRA